MRRFFYRLWLRATRRAPRAMTPKEKRAGWNYLEGVEERNEGDRLEVTETAPDPVDGAEEGPRRDALHKTLTADITRLIGSLDWALRWIETNGEVPLDDDEPEEFARYREAKALMAPPEDESAGAQ